MVNKITWTKLITRPQTGLTTDFVLRGLEKNFVKLVGTHLDVKAELIELQGTVYESKESRLRVNSIFEKKYKKDPSFFKAHVTKGEMAVKNTIRKSQDLTTDITKINNQDLVSRFAEFERIYYEFIPYLHTVFAPEAILTKNLKREIKRHLKTNSMDKIEDSFRVLTFVQKDTDFYSEQKDLLGIAISKKHGKAYDNKIKEHTKLFGYMGLTNSFLSNPYNEKHFLSLIKEIQDPEFEIKKLEKNRNLNRKRYFNLVRSFPKRTIQIAEELQTYMLFRNSRIEGLKKSQNNIKPLLNELCRRYREEYENIIWYTAEEIKELVGSGVKAAVSDRIKYFSMEIVNENISYSTKARTKKKKARIDEFKGSIAQMGKVTGKVRLVFSIDDIKKVEEGDVLVTTMTTPDFVIAMKKAGAIVTDEGGVLSHAAIVSREFGTPCIIGTRIATQSLKDDDLVEVDANEGVVRRLKK